MESYSDHTHEVERRVAAIQIMPRDCCGFYAVREGALAPRRECFFCTYGKFNLEQELLNTKGLCQFKK